MELTSNFKPQDNSSPLNSTTTNNGTQTQNQTSLPITRSDPNSPYPTTFVTADTSSFKQVVQMLTGSSESNSPKQLQPNQTHDTKTTTTTTASPTTANGGASSSSTNCCGTAKGYVIPPIKTTPKKQGFKLYERRNSIKHLISPLNSAATTSNSNHQLQTTSFSPRYKQEILSPSLLDFPSLTLSPVTPLVDDPFLKSSPSNFTHGLANGPGPRTGPISSSSEEEEEKAIAEKGFFLHPSPVSTPRDSQPQLLPLFPLSSPRISNP